jgi:serine/threonine protein kinase
MYVVTEVLDYSLKDYLEARHEQHMPITPDVVKQITNNFLYCVAVLHAKGFAHLDIKPENIMRGQSIWKLIDVDGCVPLNKEVSIDDQTISFSPCYCAPEWANFLVGGGKRLMVRDALDVWSVGLSLCELIILDAALKPKYASLFRAVGSHRNEVVLSCWNLKGQ